LYGDGRDAAETGFRQRANLTARKATYFERNRGAFAPIFGDLFGVTLSKELIREDLE
jgi:hypothetical protein